MEKFPNSNKAFDYVICMGDSDSDEPMHQAVNQAGFGSIVVQRSSEETSRKTVAQYRLTSVAKAREFLEYITDKRVQNERVTVAN